MTTDITELAQREKFEAWWERTQHNGNPPRFGWSHWRDGEGYKVDDDDSELDGMWSAWKAAGAELVEALEKAQQRIAELESRTVTVKLPDPPGPMSVGARTVYFGIVADVVGAFQDGLNAAGIKVEAE